MHPLAEARCRGVLPKWFLQVRSAYFVSRSLTSSTLFRFAAMCRTVLPEPSVHERHSAMLGMVEETFGISSKKQGKYKSESEHLICTIPTGATSILLIGIYLQNDYWVLIHHAAFLWTKLQWVQWACMVLTKTSHHSRGSGTSLLTPCCFCTQCAYADVKCEDDILKIDT